MRTAVRLLAAAICWMAIGWAAPPLTTIQDVLYKADGTPFNGTLLIEWRSFEAVDTSNIATSSLSAPIVNGVLRVQLIPTTNASAGAYYSVRYSSDGKIQFQETWGVPPSSTTLRLRDVRLTSTSGTVTPPPETTPITEADVVGLVEDLAIRPVKGAGYAPSRAIFADASGALQAVVGNLTDCVRVDGTAGPCGEPAIAGPAFTDGETPAGLVNGSNAVFTLADAPAPDTSLALYRNGLLQKRAVDYTISGNTITFTAGSIPQDGDVLAASYRIGGGAGPIIDPELGAGVISDVNVSDVAGIRESKLALNYPTHSNANDPTAQQKAALAGTSGAPSATNRYVTDQDPRLSDTRVAAGHGLLNTVHTDTVAAAPSRGDLIVAQGSSPVLWTRLPIGAANRCLMSNGSDAVWNTCLYTGFAAGAVPFVDAAGNLAQNSARLAWDNTNRKLSVANNSGGATLYVYDSLPAAGVTSLAVRAGQGQGAEALQRWLDASGGELARVDSAGRFAGASFRGATSGVRAAWQDAGNPADPGTVSNGDFWFNSGIQARKTVEAGQKHTVPQVICASEGASTSVSGLTRLGSCTIPGGFLKPGDHVEIKFDYAHSGTATGFSFEVRWGGSTMVSRSGAASESVVTGRGEAGVYFGGAQLSSQSWGSQLALQAAVSVSVESLGAPLTVDFLGKMNGSTSETVSLRNFSVVRLAGQQNP
jgi:hypothetical protein